MTDTCIENLAWSGPCALMESHQQPGNSVHLFYTSESRRPVYFLQLNKEARDLHQHLEDEDVVNIFCMLCL